MPIHLTSMLTRFGMRVSEDPLQTPPLSTFPRITIPMSCEQGHSCEIQKKYCPAYLVLIRDGHTEWALIRSYNRRKRVQVGNECFSSENESKVKIELEIMSIFLT